MIIEVWKDDQGLHPIMFPEGGIEDDVLRYGKDMASLQGEKVLVKVIEDFNWDACMNAFREYEESLEPKFEEFVE